MFRRCDDRSHIEHDRAQSPPRFGRSQHVARAPGATPPADRRVIAAKKPPNKSAVHGAWSPSPSRAEQPPRLRAEREGADMNEIERERRQRERREVTTNRRTGPRPRGERTERRGRSDARERQEALGAGGLRIVHFEEHPIGRPREGRRPDARDGAIDVAFADALTAQDGHQRDPTSARMNVLVAIRSANRISSAGSMAIRTLPILSVAYVLGLFAIDPPYGAPVSARTSSTMAACASSSVARPAGARPPTGTARTSTRAPGTSAPPTACAAPIGKATARIPRGSARPVWNAAASSASPAASTTWPRQSGARGILPRAAETSATEPAGTASGGSDAVARSSAVSGCVASRARAATGTPGRSGPPE